MCSLSSIKNSTEIESSFIDTALLLEKKKPTKPAKRQQSSSLEQ